MDDNLEDEGYHTDELSLAESTTTLDPEVLVSREEYGHNYHPPFLIDHDYPFPQDDRYGESLSLVIFVLVTDKYFHCPAQNVATILDVGTGWGLWCVQMARRFPDATIIGTDIPPLEHWCPINVHFQVDDLDKPWTFQEDSVDLVHAGNMYGVAIRPTCWPDFLANTMRTLKDDGWLVCHGLDWHIYTENKPLPPDDDFIYWLKLLDDGLKTRGFTSRFAPQLVKKELGEAGFTHVHIEGFKAPVGGWPSDGKLKLAGLVCLENLERRLDAVSARPMEGWLGMSSNERKLRNTLALKALERWQRDGIYAYFTL